MGFQSLVWKKVVAGMMAGGIGQLMASPTDLIKRQIQMEGRQRLLGQPPQVHGTWDAASKVLQQAGNLARLLAKCVVGGAGQPQ